MVFRPMKSSSGLGVQMERQVLGQQVHCAPGGELVSLVGYAQGFDGHLMQPAPRGRFERLLRWLLRLP